MSGSRRRGWARAGALAPLFVVAVAAVSLVAGTPGGVDGAAATAAGAGPRQVAGTPVLELLEQDFAIEANGIIRLVYRLTGDVGTTAELVPTTTSTTTTTTTTTTVPVAPETDSAAGSELPATGPPTGTITPGSPVIDPPEPPAEPLRLTVEVTNYRPLERVSAIERVVGSDVDPSAFADVSSVVDGVALDDLRDRVVFDDDGSVIFTLEIPTDGANSVEEKLRFDRAGLYPLRVQVLVGDPADNDVLVTAGTIVQRLPGPDDAATAGSALPSAGATAEPPPIDLAVVSVTAAAGPTATAEETRAAYRSLDAGVELAAALEAPVTLMVPPPLVASRAETSDGRSLLAQSLADDELVALPAVPLDVSSAVAVEQSDTFARFVRIGEDLLTEAVPTTPSRRDMWVAFEPLSAPGAQALRDLGVRFVVMPSEMYLDTVGARLPATDLFVEVELPDGGTLPLLVVDDLAGQLTAAAADEILLDSTTTEWAVATLATMLVEREQADVLTRTARRSRVLTTPDLEAPDPRLLGGLERLAASTPSIRFTAGSSLTGVTDVQIDNGRRVSVRLPDVAGPPLAERVELIDTVGVQMSSAASMLPDTDARPEQWSTQLDVLISTDYSDAEAVEVTDRLVADAQRLKDAVDLPEPFTFTLTGRNGNIEIRLGNDSDDPLRVVVQLASTKVNFPLGDEEVTLRPNAETSVIVPVEARSNGTSSITLQVSTPAGEVLAEPVTLTSRVTALTGFGQVLTGGFVLVLFTWWFAHWRARRRTVIVGDVRQRHPSSGK
jgi:hypothetical protein